MESKMDLGTLYVGDGVLMVSPDDFEIDSFACQRVKHAGRKDTMAMEIVFVSKTGTATKMVFHGVTVDLWSILTGRMQFKIVNLRHQQHESAKPIGVFALADDGDMYRLFTANAVGLDSGDALQ